MRLEVPRPRVLAIPVAADEGVQELKSVAVRVDLEDRAIIVGTASRGHPVQC